MSDLDKLRRMATVMKDGTTLKSVLDEVCALIPRVTQWIHVPTSGSAVCRYDAHTGKPNMYEIRYQQGDMGNLVHELIHAAVNEAYGQDFVNYPNPTAAATAPERTLDGQGRCTNEERRQGHWMSDGGNMKAGTTLATLTEWANKSTELKLEQKNAIVQKFQYGAMNPHKEYDTVITQVLVWMHEWGYPIAGANPAAKPVVNALYEEVDKAVNQAHASRQRGV